MGTEAAVPNADAEFRTEPSGHEAVVHALDGECRHREIGRVRGGDRSEDMYALDGPQSPVQLRRERCLMVADVLPADAAQLVHGRAKCNGTDHVGRAGLLSLGWFGPDDLVQVDQV